MTDLIELSASDSVKQWDKQIRLFARYFLAHVELPRDTPFRLLDVGCGTGSALMEIQRCVRRAELYGCDIDDLHVRLAQHMNPAPIKFFQSDIAGISDSYDCIYASNILEHVRDWKDCLMHLCKKAPTVFVLVPYREDISQLPTSGVEHVDHLNTYDRNSMSFLNSSIFAVQSRVIRTPYAWGGPIHQEIARKLAKSREGRSYVIPKEIIFKISGRTGLEKPDLQARFRNRVSAEARAMRVLWRARRDRAK